MAVVVVVLVASVPVQARDKTAGAVVNAAIPQSSERPNVVLFLIDNLGSVVSPYWDAMPKTRTLIADRGRTFTQAFAPTPVCCPARATILTGRYGHNTGVLANGGMRGGIEAFQRNGNEARTFPIALQASGCRTMLAGKYLNGYEKQRRHLPPGWTEWYAAASGSGGFGPSTVSGFHYGYNYYLNENGTLVWYVNDDEDYATDVVAAQTAGFVEHSDEVDDEHLSSRSCRPPHPTFPCRPRGDAPTTRGATHPCPSGPTPPRPTAPTSPRGCSSRLRCIAASAPGQPPTSRTGWDRCSASTTSWQTSSTHSIGPASSTTPICSSYPTTA
ncbi:MAG: hypothetical protein DYH08_05710 [Actinobacteria bacterium ATB1]|nr:hypothetical protein [Actinobacteria bacterium ATB1]